MSKTQYKRVSSVMIKLTEKEHLELSAQGWRSLEKFEKGLGNQTDWFNVAFRLRFALELATIYYEQVTALGFKIAYDNCINVYTRTINNTPSVWSMTETELEQIKEALEALDIVQRQMLRKDMAQIMRKAVMYMRSNYVKDQTLKPLPPKRL